MNVVHSLKPGETPSHSASHQGFILCATFLNITTRLRMVRCGCGSVGVIFSIYLNSILYGGALFARFLCWEGNVFEPESPKAWMKFVLRVIQSRKNSPAASSYRSLTKCNNKYEIDVQIKLECKVQKPLFTSILLKHDYDLASITRKGTIGHFT